MGEIRGLSPIPWVKNHRWNSPATANAVPYGFSAYRGFRSPPLALTSHHG
jgi:hypothetical protein